MAIGVGVLLVLALVGALVYIGLRDDDDRDPLQERLAEFGERETPQSLEEVELSMNFKDRVLIPLLRSMADLTSRLTPEKQIEHTRKQLDMAGMAGQIEPAVFFMIRVVAAVMFPILSFLIFFVFSTGIFGQQTSAAITAGSAALGYFLPSLWLGSKISKRQDTIVKALPDALDLLTICVEAGLGFDAAMGKVYEKWDNDLSLAFGRVLREIQLGKGRREALKDMSDRLGVPDVTTFIAAVIQADSLGVSMSQILRVQSDQMRIKRRQRAQEKAQAAPVKMMIPLAFLIFPSIYIVLLGPAILGVIEAGVADSF
ncbi:MAG: type II secretion system F family protein [Chloroflexota bacterium]